MNEDITSPDIIKILHSGNQLSTASAVFAAPLEALEQQGLIRMWSVATGQQGKFILHTLAQRALLEFEDRELKADRIKSGTPLSVVCNELTVSFTEGIILSMDHDHKIALISHEGMNVSVMLRAFHRYATRMIRLDIRP